VTDPTLAGAEKPGNQGRAKPESNNVEAIVVKPDGVKYVKARFLWAPPRIEDYCRIGAIKYLRTLYGDEPIPERDIGREKAMLLISWALRRAENMDEQVYPWPLNAFNATTGEWNIAALRMADIRDQCPNIDELWGDYRAFSESEFPGKWTPEQWRALVTEGKELSLETLLSRRGFLPILRALGGLALHYATSSPATSPGGKP
jgi:hypothetical protein